MQNNTEMINLKLSDSVATEGGYERMKRKGEWEWGGRNKEGKFPNN